MYLSRVILALAIAILLGVSPALAANKTFVDPAFGTTATYPSTIFDTIVPPTDSALGRMWSSKDGATLRIFGEENTGNLTPIALSETLGKGWDTVTSSQVGARWMVLTGIKDGLRIYHRAEVGSNGRVHSIEMRYPPELSDQYDRVAEMVAASLIGP